MDKDTILITGVTGQLGSYLAEHYLEKGCRIVGFSRRTATHSTDRVDHLMVNPDFEYLEGDITDMTFLVKLFSSLKPDFCVNTAAQSHVHSSFTQPSSTWDITGKGAMNIVDALLACSPKTRLVHLSTSEMFGDKYDTRRLEGNTEKYQDENTVLRPQSPYAVAKIAAHHYLRLMRDTHTAHLSSLIAFNYESPRRGDNFVTQKIVRWFQRYKEWRDTEFVTYHGSANVSPSEDNMFGGMDNDGELRFFPKLRLGNLDSYRDWSAATDVVHAVDLMLQADKPDDYVVGSGETRTVREFLKVVCKTILDDDDYMKYVVIDPKFFRPAEVDYLRADPQKIKTVLRWEPSVSFNQLVESMCYE
jgi:GDPmannose 4,6-dehydratase